MSSEDLPPAEATAGGGAEESGARIYPFTRSASSAVPSPRFPITGRTPEPPLSAEASVIPMPSTGFERSASPATTGTAPGTRAYQIEQLHELELTEWERIRAAIRIIQRHYGSKPTWVVFRR